MVRGKGVETYPAHHYKILIQNLNFTVPFQTSRPFNKTWDSSLSVNNSFIYTTESKSLKDWFSFIRMFSHRTLIPKSNSDTLEKNYMVNFQSNYH